MNIVFDETFSVMKRELPVTLKYENIIFVFEDVDIASPIVKRRVATAMQGSDTGATTTALPSPASIREAIMAQVSKDGSALPSRWSALDPRRIESRFP